MEGQFENGALNGFGRMIKSNGYRAIGLWKAGYMYGWGKQIQPDGFQRIGLFEVLPKHGKYVKSYNWRRDFIAKKIMFEQYITFSEEVKKTLKDRKDKEEKELKEEQEQRKSKMDAE